MPPLGPGIVRNVSGMGRQRIESISTSEMGGISYAVSAHCRWRSSERLDRSSADCPPRRWLSRTRSPVLADVLKPPEPARVYTVAVLLHRLASRLTRTPAA